MFNLQPMEMIIIAAIALVVFGPKKLPEIGRSMGNALREFNRARNDFMESLNADLDAEPDRSAANYGAADTPASDEPAALEPGPRTLEYPEPLDLDKADALPYGSDFQAVEGDSQPSFRTAQPEYAPAGTIATTSAHAGEGKD